VNTIHPEAAQRIQHELLNDENIYWAGVPDPKVIFHSDDWVMIPFSLVWTGFCVFWELSAMEIFGTSANKQPDLFMELWGIPFLLIGNYMVWGRFFVDAWLKRRTYYAVTNRRVMVLQDGLKKKTSMTFLNSIPSIEQEGSETGTLWFGPKYPIIAGRRQPNRGLSRFSVGEIPIFADIDGVGSVHRLVVELRDKSGATSPLTYSS
jgi:hypothetical protein